MWARACDKQIALPEKTSGRFVPARSQAGEAPPGRRESRRAKLTPRGGRRSGRLPSANSTMVPIAPTLTPCRGTGRGRSRRTLCQCGECRRRWIPMPPRGACSRYFSGVAEPRTFTCPLSPAGAKVQPRPSQRPEGQPPSGRGNALPPLRREIRVQQPPTWRAPRATPEQGSSGRPAKKSWVRSKM
jgi:hypothetical protein